MTSVGIVTRTLLTMKVPRWAVSQASRKFSNSQSRGNARGSIVIWVFVLSAAKKSRAKGPIRDGRDDDEDGVQRATPEQARHAQVRSRSFRYRMLGTRMSRAVRTAMDAP